MHTHACVTLHTLSGLFVGLGEGAPVVHVEFREQLVGVDYLPTK